MRTSLDPANIRAIASDLDGTLLRPDKTLSERTLRILRSCMEKGIKLIIATGRSTDSGEVYRRLIGSSGPQIYYNGAEVVDAAAGKMIHTEFLDSDPALFCNRLAREMGLYFQVYFPDGTAGPGEILMADRITKEAEEYTFYTGVPVLEGDVEAMLLKIPSVIKGMFITSVENQEKMRPLLWERYGASICITNSSPVFHEILAPGVSKGSGLSRTLQYLGIKPENTLAFGDEENDIPLFKTAGFSAAPANAKENVKEAADFHIPSNTEDGVAAFLEEHFGR